MSDALARALAYREPRLEARLVEREIADDAMEAAALFEEVKRFLVLSAGSPDGIPMWSYRIDAAWHELVLFTESYARLCATCFQRFLAHDPAAPEASEQAANVDSAPRPHRPAPRFDDFQAAYQARFERPLPPLWDDTGAVRADRRVCNASAGTTAVRCAGGRAELIGAGGDVLLRTDARAEPALRFLATHRTFYVRELPGVAAEDGVALCAALVRSRALVPCW
jgi:hypothetical protein